MALSISNFKSNFTNIARPNKYKVFLPIVLGGNGFDGGATFIGRNPNKLDLLCNTVTFPGRQILSVDHYTSMRAVQKAYAFGAGTFSIGFILTDDWFAWDYLNTWQNSVIENVESDRQNYRMNFKDEYSADVDLHHLNNAGVTRKAVRMFNCFPTTLNQIDFSGSATTEAIYCTAEFQFDNWTDLRIDRG